MRLTREIKEEITISVTDENTAKCERSCRFLSSDNINKPNPTGFCYFFNRKLGPHYSGNGIERCDACKIKFGKKGEEFDP